MLASLSPTVWDALMSYLILCIMLMQVLPLEVSMHGHILFSLAARNSSKLVMVKTHTDPDMK